MPDSQMLQIFVITLREGLEAFLIVAITVGILRQTGRAALLPAVFWATVTAVVASVAASQLFAKSGLTPMWEGALAAAAMVMVSSMTVYMWRTARSLKTTIRNKIDQATIDRPSRAAWWGVFGFVLLMIVREGMETALLLSYLFLTGETAQRQLLFIGGVLGVLGAVLMAGAWLRVGHRINLSRFFQVTAVFLLIFAVQLAVYAFHEFSEAGAIPFVDNAFWHNATEPFGPEGLYGQWLTWLMVLVPATWLFSAWVRDRSVITAA